MYGNSLMEQASRDALETLCAYGVLKSDASLAEPTAARIVPTLSKLLSPDEYTPKRVIHNPKAVIVYWKDGEKTVVRLREGDRDDIYSAFAQALVKKLFKGTTTAHKMVNRVLEEQTPKKKG